MQEANLACHRNGSFDSKNTNDGEGISIDGKHIVLLQGPVGPFFKDLSIMLAQHDANVTHVCFNSADEFFSEAKNRVRFRKPDAEWKGWLKALHQRAPIDFIILFGCERPRHVTALAFGEAYGIPVLSLEEGYVRPGFITAEILGNNRRSPLKNADLSLETTDLPPEPTPAPGHAFNHMSWYGFVYYIVRHLGALTGKPAGHHKQRKLLAEAFYWVRNVYRKQTGRLANKRIIDRLFDDLQKRYVIVPMQVRDDGQLIAAGRGWSNDKVIEKLIPSFAANAPKDLHLVFKAHPLERGHTNAKSKIADLVDAYGLQGRVFYIDDGSMGQVTKHAMAMITINSTSAISAIHFNIPLAVLGDAMFRRHDLSVCIDDEIDIHKFWATIKPSDPIANERFIANIRRLSLLPGDFYSKNNRLTACSEIVKKTKMVLTKPQ